MLWIEGLVALSIAVAFLIHAFFAFKPEHVEHHPARVRSAPILQGLTLGLFIGFVIVPLRMGVMNLTRLRRPGLHGRCLRLRFCRRFILLIIIRRGALLKVPVLKTYLRAYRRASLLKTRDDANKHLARLDEIEGRKKAA